MLFLNAARGASSAGNFRALSRLCFVTCTMLLLGAAESLAQRATAQEEYEVKAAFLYNFTKFTQWPAGAFPAQDSPLVIGILGEDPFGDYLDGIVRGEQVQDRAFVIQRYRRLAEMKTCHVLFISRSESARLEQIFAALRKRGVLSVGEVEGFAARGGMIEFVNYEGKLRLRINLAAARSEGLTLSSKLLRPAEIVGNP